MTIFLALCLVVGVRMLSSGEPTVAIIGGIVVALYAILTTPLTKEEREKYE